MDITETNFKRTKSELIAIYRLEFYKNKKNWKLQKEAPRLKLPSTKANHKILNKTYEVEVDDVEPITPHNTAFLHEKPDDDPNIPNREYDVEETASHQHGCGEHTWMTQPWSGEKSEQAWQQTQLWGGDKSERTRQEDKGEQLRQETQPWNEEKSERAWQETQTWRGEKRERAWHEGEESERAWQEAQLWSGAKSERVWLDGEKSEQAWQGAQLWSRDKKERAWQEVQKRGRAWQEGEKIERAWQEGEKSEQVWQETQSWSGTKSEQAGQETQQEWCTTESEGVREEQTCEHCDRQYPHQHDLWTPVLRPGSARPPRDAVEPPIEYASPAEMLLLAEEWLQKHGHPALHDFSPYQDQCAMLDESAEFLRGAHYAPHSSETDLSVTPDGMDAWWMCGGTYALSARQLCRGVQRHHAALAALLREHATRELLYGACTHCECLPQRDTDPPRVPAAPHHIRIAAGRPYRLYH